MPLISFMACRCPFFLPHRALSALPVQNACGRITWLLLFHCHSYAAKLSHVVFPTWPNFPTVPLIRSIFNDLKLLNTNYRACQVECDPIYGAQAAEYTWGLCLAPLKCLGLYVHASLFGPKYTSRLQLPWTATPQASTSCLLEVNTCPGHVFKLRSSSLLLA